MRKHANCHAPRDFPSQDRSPAAPPPRIAMNGRGGCHAGGTCRSAPPTARQRERDAVSGRRQPPVAFGDPLPYVARIRRMRIQQFAQRYLPVSRSLPFAVPLLSQDPSRVLAEAQDIQPAGVMIHFLPTAIHQQYPRPFLLPPACHFPPRSSRGRSCRARRPPVSRAACRPGRAHDIHRQFVGYLS